MCACQAPEDVPYEQAYGGRPGEGRGLLKAGAQARGGSPAGRGRGGALGVGYGRGGSPGPPPGGDGYEDLVSRAPSYAPANLNRAFDPEQLQQAGSFAFFGAPGGGVAAGMYRCGAVRGGGHVCGV